MFDFLSLVEKHGGRILLGTIFVSAILAVAFPMPCHADEVPKTDVPTDLPSDIKPPSVTRVDFSPPQADRVKLHFEVFSKDEKKNLEVVVYYGTEDGGLNPTMWEFCKDQILPDKMKDDENSGKYTVTLCDLNPDTNYFYRIVAQNSAGVEWSEPGDFKTAPFNWSFFGLGFNLGKKHVDRSKDRVAIAMVYDIDKEATARVYGRRGKKTDELPEISKSKIDQLIRVLQERINPGGEMNVSIRQLGTGQIEITIPRGKPEYVRRIQKRISDSGTLEFRILANPHDDQHKKLIELALKNEKELPDPPHEIYSKDGEDKELLGWWNPVDLKREDEFGYMRDRKDIITRVTLIGGVPRLEVLVVKDMYDVTGDYFNRCQVGADNYGRPAVHFNLNSKGAELLGKLTGDHRPVEGAKPYRYCLGIILNGGLYSAPTINERITNRGIISGDFDNQKAQDLVNVLNAGRLPVILERVPSSEWTFRPTPADAEPPLGDTEPTPGSVKSAPGDVELTPGSVESTSDDDTMSYGEIAILVLVVFLFVFIAIAGVFYRSRKVKCAELQNDPDAGQE